MNEKRTPSSALLQDLNDSAGSEKVRTRVGLFLRAQKLGSVTQACREFSTSPQLYYFWWRRFRNSGFRMEGLQERSRRPKNISKKTPAEIEERVLKLREGGRRSGEEIRMVLEREEKITLSLPTVYRILARRNRDGRTGVSPKRKARSRTLSFPSNEKPPAPPSQEEDEIIGGRYRLLKRLGSGGGGTVYLAEDERSKGERLALKRLTLRKGSDPGLAVILQNEFSALSQLRHPSLARVFDFGITDREMFFTSEFIPGRDFLSALQGADLNLIFELILQALGALDFLHRKGILHLDLKPSNLLVTDPDETGELKVKLIDFGSAEWRKKGQAAPGEIMGTPPYIAPEILMEKPPTFSSDLYSFGMILHQIFIGSFPFEAKEPLAMMKEQLYRDPSPPSSLHPALPTSFGLFLAKMIARDPKERFQTAQEVLEAMNACLEERFSLKPLSAPSKILDSFDGLLRPELAEGFIASLRDPAPKVMGVSGGEKTGKSRLLTRVKERLQLQGLFPFFAYGLEDVKEFLKRGLPGPLIADLEGEVDTRSVEEVLEAIDRRKISALVATRIPPSPALLATRWVELLPLTQEQILNFLRKEIEGFPETPPDWIASAGGNPGRLEILLRELKEVGLLQWCERGWKWEPSADPPCGDLLKNHERRWEDRRQEVAEILKISPAGLNASTLAGLFGWELGPLQEKLAQWWEEGFLRGRRTKKIFHYTLKEGAAEESSTLVQDDWKSLEAKFQSLYEEGNFDAGKRLADLLFSQISDLKKFPEELRILCARHSVACGEGEKALKLLADLTDEKKGLVWEIRSRAHFLLSRLQEAQEALAHAEKIFSEISDAAGLSRAFNLGGSILKKLSDFSSAEKSFEKAIVAARGAGDDYLQGLAQMNLALFHQERGDFQRAHLAYEEAFRFEQQAGHPLLSVKLRHNRLNLLFSMGRAQEAEKTCYELLHLAVKNRYPEQQAAALNFLALIAGQKNHRDLQDSYLNQALSFLRPLNLPLLYAQTLLNRSFLCWETRRFTPAELEARYALSLAEKHSQPLLSAWARLLLGRILRDRPRSDFEEAERNLLRARQLIHRAENRPLLWEVELDLGLLAKKKGDKPKAREHLNSAQRQLEELLAQVPESIRQTYLRDRKLEKILEERKSLEED